MITLDLSPTEEAQVSAIARQIGLAPAEYAKKLVQENLPLPSAPTEPPPIDAENAAAIAQFKAWAAEDATDARMRYARRLPSLTNSCRT